MKPLVSLAVNGMGLTYIQFACITFNFPSVYPITGDNMNYTSAAVGAIMSLAVVTWFTTAGKHFSGPEVASVHAIVGDVEESRSQNGEENRAFS